MTRYRVVANHTRPVYLKPEGERRGSWWTSVLEDAATYDYREACEQVGELRRLDTVSRRWYGPTVRLAEAGSI